MTSASDEEGGGGGGGGGGPRPPPPPPPQCHYVLHAAPDSFRTTKILIAARYSGVEVSVSNPSPPRLTPGGGEGGAGGGGGGPFPDEGDAYAARRSPSGRLPVLEIIPATAATTGGGGGGERESESSSSLPPVVLFGSNAIARYVARAGANKPGAGGGSSQPSQQLLGNLDDPVEMALVDGWVEYATNELEVPASVWVYPALGRMPFRESAYKKAKADLSVALSSLNNHLLDKTYLVGHGITLADVAVASALFQPLTLVCDESYMEPYANVVRWFMTCVNQPEFAEVVGDDVNMCREERMPPGMGRAEGDGDKREVGEGAARRKEKKKKNAKPAQRKKGKQVEGDAGSRNNHDKKVTAPSAPALVAPPPAAKKRAEEHPYKLLDREHPSSFSIDAWKRTYSNASSLRTVMDHFWKSFDHDGWSLWYQSYKHDEENTRAFIASNRVGGFQQRCEAIRRWAFGVMDVLGTEDEGLEVRGVWLLRGDTIECMMEANDDAEWYEWKKLSGRDMPPTEEVRRMVSDFWCEEEEGMVGGKTVQDSKVFK